MTSSAEFSARIGPLRRARRGVPAGPVLLAIAVGLAGTLYLWWRSTPFVLGLAGWVYSTGRLTGLGAGYLLIVLLFLMSRLPALDRGIGTDRLTRWHSTLGRYVVMLAVAHALTTIWGYALLAHVSPIIETKVLLLTYPDVLMATAALGLLVLIGTLAARSARRRLRYETWHLLHFYTYLAVALSFAHEFANGTDFDQSLSARIAWASLYVTVFLTLLWYRLLVPIRMSSRHQLRVDEVRRESDNTVSIWMSGRHLDQLIVEPGQFFRWRFLTWGLWWAANPYSLSAPPDGNRLRITVKASGDHSRALRELQPGTRVQAEGPYGALIPQLRTRRRVLLIAGGIGITPLRALFEALPGGPGDLTLLYRVRNDQDILFGRELEQIAARRQATLRFVTGRRGRSGNDPLSAGNLLRTIPALVEHDVYLCGSLGLVDQLRKSLRDAGVPRGQIHQEAFGFDAGRSSATAAGRHRASR